MTGLNETRTSLPFPRRFAAVLLVLLVALLPLYGFWHMREQYEPLSFAFAGIVVLGIWQIVIITIGVIWVYFVKSRRFYNLYKNIAYIFLPGIITYLPALLLYLFDIVWPIYIAAVLAVGFFILLFVTISNSSEKAADDNDEENLVKLTSTEEEIGFYFHGPAGSKSD